MGKKIKGILLLLCPILSAGCADKTGYQMESPQSTGDVVRGTIITSYIQQSGGAASVWKGWGAGRLYEDTGLLLETVTSEGPAAEELKLRMSSGTVPDIIGFSDREQAQLYIDAELLLPLNDYRELLPSLFEDEAYSAALEWSMAGNGGEELLLAPLSVGEAGEKEYRSMPMLLRSAWERAGSPGVSGLEDYLDVIEQMKKAKPTSDVGESMYGICLWQGDGKISEHAASLAYMYGIDMQIISPLMETNMVTNSIRSVLDEDSFYKRAVHFYYEANRRGLLDPDSPNQTAGNVERKMKSGRVLFAADAGMTGTEGILRTDREAAYMPLPAEDMKLYLEPDHIVGTGQCLAVNKHSERAEDAVRLLDWLYREETVVCLYNGPEGEVWEYGENGVPYVTRQGVEILENGGEELPGVQGSLQDGIRPFGVLGRTPASLTAEGYPFSSSYWPVEEGQDEIAGGQGDWDTVRASVAVYLTDTLPPGLSQISDEIEKLVYKAFWNMIYAKDEEEFQAIWQSLSEEADKLGMERLTAFYRDAWGRALERAAEYQKQEQ